LNATVLKWMDLYSALSNYRYYFYIGLHNMFTPALLNLVD